MKESLTISKSLYKAWREHPRLGWWYVQDRERYNWINEQIHGTMGGPETGAAVEEQVLRLFTNDQLVRIPDQWDAPGEMSAQTGIAIEKKMRLIAQAYVTFQDLLCVVDLLRLNEDGRYDLIEIKSKSSIRRRTQAEPLEDDLVADASFQRYVLRHALGDAFSGRCFIAYVNKEYVRQGDIDPHQLIVLEEVTDDLSSDEFVAEQINRLKEDVTLIEEAFHARYPYNGERHEVYFGHEPPLGSVWRIPGSVKKLSQRIREGLTMIMDMNEADTRLLHKADGSASLQSTYVNKYQREETIIDQQAIQDILDRYPLPYFFYDYETVSSPVPLLDGTSPNQQVVVQYSLHELIQPGMDTNHYACIIGPGERTNRRVIEHLIQTTTGKEGTFIVWNQSFEKTRNKELAAAYPEYAAELERINANTFDLMDIFKNLHYFDRRFNGSASIKYVLPVLTDITYKNLEVQKGDQAANLLAGIISGSILPEQVANIQRQLLDYCHLDTQAMVEIHHQVRHSL